MSICLKHFKQAPLFGHSSESSRGCFFDCFVFDGAMRKDFFDIERRWSIRGQLDPFIPPKLAGVMSETIPYREKFSRLLGNEEI